VGVPVRRGQETPEWFLRCRNTTERLHMGKEVRIGRCKNLGTSWACLEQHGRHLVALLPNMFDGKPKFVYSTPARFVTDFDDPPGRSWHCDVLQFQSYLFLIAHRV
jgi:hypothetical protein